MRAAVLANIQLGEMKSEDIEYPKHGPYGFTDETLAPDFLEACPEDVEVGDDLLGTCIPDTRIGDKGTVTRTYLEWKTFLNQQDKLPPRFTGEAGQNLCAETPHFGTQFGYPVQQQRGGFLKMTGERKGVSQRVELSVEHDQCVEPEFVQGFPGHFGRDKGMAVAVAADPGAEFQSWTGFGCTHEIGGEAEFTPSPAQPGIKLGDSLRENIPEIKHQGPAFVGHIGLVEKNFPAAPESFEADLDLSADLPSFDRREILAVILGQKLMNRTMLVENCSSLCLGGMCGKNRFHAHSGEIGRDFPGTEPLFHKT